MIRVLFLAAAMAAAQEPSTPTFRSGVELIQVSVIAQDKHGKPIADLTREDFQLFDNGSPREIRLFVAEKPGPQPESKIPGIFTNQPSHRGYSVILIDSLFTDFGDPDKGEGSSLARLQTLRMLRSIPAADRVAIYALERSLRVICEFTTDRDLLVQRLGKWKPSVDTPDTSNSILQASMGATSEDHRGDAPEKALAATITAGSQVRESSLESAMILIADHLAPIPGRKNLILLGRHFAIGPRPLQTFKDANVAIYPIDVNGPMIAPRSMLSLAEQTGGVAYYGRNDVNAAIREAMDDGRTGYTLGFYQSDDDRPSQVHLLDVRVNRPDVTLRYRASYRTEAVQKAGLAEALDRPVESTTVSLRATATRSQDRLDVRVVVDLAGLDLALAGDRRTGRIDIVARFTGPDGKSAGPLVSLKLNLNLRQATYETVLRQGIAYHNLMKIPPKAVELRLLFANQASGKIGTLIIPLSEVAAGAK